MGPATRYTLRRDTASIMKTWFENTTIELTKIKANQAGLSGKTVKISFFRKKCSTVTGANPEFFLGGEGTKN